MYARFVCTDGCVTPMKKEQKSFINKTNYLRHYEKYHNEFYINRRMAEKTNIEVITKKNLSRLPENEAVILNTTYQAEETDGSVIEVTVQGTITKKIISPPPKKVANIVDGMANVSLDADEYARFLAFQKFEQKELKKKIKEEKKTEVHDEEVEVTKVK